LLVVEYNFEKEVKGMGTSIAASGKKKMSGFTKGYLILLILVVVSWAVFKVITPHNFGSPANLLQYFQASLMAATGAVGFYFVMVMGMFDFSIGANIMLSAIVGCKLARKAFHMGYAGLIIGSMVTGALVGLINGVLYVKLHIPSMIVTTGVALVAESVANYIAGGVEQTLPAGLRAFGNGTRRHHSGTCGFCNCLCYSELHQGRNLYLCDRIQRGRCEEHGYQR
jgi:ribose transport system permease protein